MRKNIKSKLKKNFDIVIIGAGGHGREIAVYIESMKKKAASINLLGFIDENKKLGTCGVSRVLGDISFLQKETSNLKKDKTLYYITAIGDPVVRKKLIERLDKIEKILPMTISHESARIFQDVLIGDGTCIAPGSIITTNVRIGRHVIVNINATISHDCVLEDYVTVSPGATICGNVKICEGAFIGAGATIMQGITIGKWSIIGAGAMVISDIPEHVTAVGVPTRIINKT